MKYIVSDSHLVIFDEGIKHDTVKRALGFKHVDGAGFIKIIGQGFSLYGHSHSLQTGIGKNDREIIDYHLKRGMVLC